MASVYQALSEPKLSVFPKSGIFLESLLISGDFYEVWKGQLKNEENLSYKVVVKTVKQTGNYNIPLIML